MTNRLKCLSCYSQQKNSLILIIVTCYLSSGSCHQCSPHGDQSEELEVVQWRPRRQTFLPAARWWRGTHCRSSHPWRGKSEIRIGKNCNCIVLSVIPSSPRHSRRSCSRDCLCPAAAEASLWQDLESFIAFLRCFPRPKLNSEIFRLIIVLFQNFINWFTNRPWDIRPPSTRRLSVWRSSRR